jgi:multiple sugar transport system substrate-binding protein
MINYLPPCGGIKMKKQISRREFLAMVGITSSAVLLAACGPTTTATEAVPTEKPADVVEPTAVPQVVPVKLEMLSYAITEGDPHDQALKLFQSAHPDWELIWTPVAGSWAEIATKIVTRVAAGNAPDMCAITTYGGSITMGKNKILLDLGELMSGDSDFANDPVPPGLLTMYSTGGHIWGMPKDYVTQGIYYNKKMFADAGVEPPTADWTWDDMIAKAKALTSGEGMDKIFGLYTETGYYQN